MRWLFILGLTFIGFKSIGQVINGYAEVTSISGAVLTIGTSDETGDTFEDGEWVVVMQMQDDVIGDVTNTASFGDLGTIRVAGRYEIRQIESHTETAGSPTSITLFTTPVNTFNTCANCAVQVITFPALGTPNYTTTGNMSALPWDGTIGGVLALHCAGILTLEHDLSADFSGFRGAGNNAGSSAGCSGGSNYRVVTQVDFADKGEGIYKNTTAAYDAGMGKILTGGGGGNSHNGGGGGGGNFSSGGDGGPGWPTCSPSAGGLGGLDMSSEISINRIFMGGGGGSGEGNNAVSTQGGDGGGIILVKAEEITTGTCTSVNVTVNGESISFAGNDGGGGGGAAGSVVIETTLWSVDPGCPMVIEAIGGDGGSVNSGATHGGGGGGGQGAVFFSTTEPVTDVTTTTAPGAGGCDNNSSPCTSAAGSGGGASGDGIVESVTGPLPVDFAGAQALCFENSVELYWSTKSEVNSDYFVVERSRDLYSWTFLENIDAAGSSSSTINYSYKDTEPIEGLVYYRLIQVDFDGEAEILYTFSMENCGAEFSVYPNPTQGMFFLNAEDISGDIYIYNAMGEAVSFQKETTQSVKVIDLSGNESGTYYLRAIKNGKLISHKIVLLP